MSIVTAEPNLKGPRFSGHESFACRYAWLAKAYRELRNDPNLFADDEEAMLALGLGKNMVRSLKFWVEAVGVAESEDRSRRMKLTAFGNAVFGHGGHDPYIEDPQTQWLLHWQLASRHDGPLFAWDYLIGRWRYPEFTRSEALAAFKRESERLGASHSDVTLGQHLDVFLHTYIATRAGPGVGVEDSLDGPLVDLNFLIPVGHRLTERGQEVVYAFRREEKPEISNALFDYCVMDYWRRFSPNEETLPFRTIAAAPGAPGQVFKLNEDDVRARLERARDPKTAPYSYHASAVQGMLTRSNHAPELSLGAIYNQGGIDG